MDQQHQQPEAKQQLIGLARRRAFETYLRFGHLPELPPSQAERKNLDPSAPLPASHAARNGQIFSWSAPPLGGHPGTEPNCRCWGTPYYGDPDARDMGAICVYDVKTGQEGLGPRRVARIARLVAQVFKSARMLYIIQVDPTQPRPASP